MFTPHVTSMTDLKEGWTKETKSTNNPTPTVHVVFVSVLIAVYFWHIKTAFWPNFYGANKRKTGGKCKGARKQQRSDSLSISDHILPTVGVLLSGCFIGFAAVGSTSLLLRIYCWWRGHVATERGETTYPAHFTPKVDVALTSKFTDY